MTKYIQNLGELSAIGESGGKVKQGSTNFTFVRGTFQPSAMMMMMTKMMMMMTTAMMIIIDHRDNGDEDDSEQLSSRRS